MAHFIGALPHRLEGDAWASSTNVSETGAPRELAGATYLKNGGMSRSSSRIASESRWRSSIRGPRSRGGRLRSS